MSILASLTETLPLNPISVPAGQQGSLFDTASISSLNCSSINNVPPITINTSRLFVSSLTVNPLGNIYLPNTLFSTGKITAYTDSNNTNINSLTFGTNVSSNPKRPSLFMPKAEGLPTKLGSGSLYVYGESGLFTGAPSQITTNILGSLNLNASTPINLSTSTANFNGALLGNTNYNSISISSLTCSSINGSIPNTYPPKFNLVSLDVNGYVNSSTITSGSVLIQKIGTSPGIIVGSGGNVSMNEGNILSVSSIGVSTFIGSTINAPTTTISKSATSSAFVGAGIISSINGQSISFANPNPQYSTITVIENMTIDSNLNAKSANILNFTISSFNGQPWTNSVLPPNFNLSSITLGSTIQGPIPFPYSGSINGIADLVVSTISANTISFGKIFTSPPTPLIINPPSGNFVGQAFTATRLNTLHPQFVDVYLMNGGAKIERSGFLDEIPIDPLTSFFGLTSKSYITVDYSVYIQNLDINNSLTLEFYGASLPPTATPYISGTITIGEAQSTFVPGFQVIKGQMTLLRGIHYIAGAATLALGIQPQGGDFVLNGTDFTTQNFPVPAGNTWKISGWG